LTIKASSDDPNEGGRCDAEFIFYLTREIQAKEHIGYFSKESRKKTDNGCLSSVCIQNALTGDVFGVLAGCDCGEQL